MNKFLLFIVLSISQIAFSQSECDKFKVMLCLQTYNSCDTFYTFDSKGIDSINWARQIYYIKRDYMAEFENFPFGSSTMQFIFLFEGKEIYRAAAMSQYNSNPYPKGVAVYVVYDGIDPRKAFKEDEISIFDFKEAKLDKELFSRAYIYLKQKGLIVDE